MSREIRVVLADDHDAVRIATMKLLERRHGMSVVGVACNGKEALELTKRLKPQVLVLDLAMPGRPGLDVLCDVVRECPDTSTVVYSGYDGGSATRAALWLGASAFVSKSAPVAELGRVVQLAAEDSGRVRPKTLRGVRRSPDPYALLSVREREVFLLVAQGMSCAEIAKRLGTSKRTVEQQRGSVLRKLDVENAATAAYLAFQLGLL